MNTFKKVSLGLGLLSVGASVVSGYRLARAKRAIQSGTVDGWIKEITGNVPYEIKSTIPTPAYIEDDKSKIWIRLSDNDIAQMALGTTSFKVAIQSILAHEMGHYLDNKLEAIQEDVYKALRKKDTTLYRNAVLERETRAWAKGRALAPNKKYFDAYNKLNLKVYNQHLDAEIRAMELSSSLKMTFNVSK